MSTTEVKSNAAAAKLFSEMAALLELAGENVFRARAYQKAAQVIEGLTKELRDIPAEELSKLSGIGEKMSGHIASVLQTGSFAELDSLRSKMPAGLLDMVRVQGIGPKRARLLYDSLAIDSLEKLENAASSGKIRGLPGFGEKTEKKILNGLKTAEEGVRRMLYWDAHCLAEELIAELKSRGVREVYYAGSLRRGKETVGDIDLICVGDDSAVEKFLKLPQVENALSAGPAKASARLKARIQCDIRIFPRKCLGSALQYFTGSKEHNVALRELALAKGFSLNEYGLFRVTDRERKHPVAAATEEDIYARLGLQYIPPELREARGEIEAASGRSLPRLIEEKDVRGDFHNHTSLTDGASGFEEMANAARDMGWEWAAIGDHSAGVGVTHGLNIGDFLKSKRGLGELQKRFPDLRLMRALEVEILKNGNLIYSDEELRQVDVVIAAVHTAFNMSGGEMTGRILKALQNPNVDIIAHLTGRLLGKREGYTVYPDPLFEAAAATGTAFEINGQPERQDLTDVAARKAKLIKIPLALTTDAHSPAQFRYMSQAVVVARRAWLEKGDVLNCLSYGELQAWLKRKT